MRVDIAEHSNVVVDCVRRLVPNDLCMEDKREKAKRKDVACALSTVTRLQRLAGNESNDISDEHVVGNDVNRGLPGSLELATALLRGSPNQEHP